MLKAIKNNRLKFIGFLLVIGVVVVSTTLAMVMKNSKSLTNTFEIGEVTTEIEENPLVNGSTIEKDPKVVNKGPNDCYVRMRVTISPSQVKDYLEKNNLINYDKENWTYNESDGFWYYNEKLPYYVEGNQKDSTSKPLFTEIKGLTDSDGKIKDEFKDLGNFEITLYQEAVQTVVYKGDQEITAPDEIWALYDQKKSN